MTIDQHFAIEFHIDELALHGFPPLDRERLDGAVRAELNRLIAERGAPGRLRRNGAIIELPGGSFTLAPSPDAATVGSQIAQAIYGGLSQ